MTKRASVQEGDPVRVSECRPMSKTKNWRVVEIVTRAAE
jgi:small subunit ribosomal protein S17